jgi:ribosomal protein S18 acetylase RimI-like enzyme
MHYDLTGQKRISDQGISIVNTLAEISEWTDTVSKILFESKPLSMNLFKFLQNESADLLAIRIDQSIIGTSMIYYDEQGNAGIYMVAVDEKFRGMGFGKKIIRQCFELIIRRNISKCYLQATKMGFPLYKTLGFERTENYILYWKIK